MILPERATVTELTITPLPAAPLHVLEIWSEPGAVAARFAAAKGFALPAMNRAAGADGLTLMRFEPTVWLVEGDGAGLDAILGEDGALTAIGGGIQRVRLSGAGWRTLLMEGGVFDAECAAFAPGHCAATIIDHVGVRLAVESDTACTAYVPVSFAADLIAFWRRAVAA
jgi:heterotetrameric sarcosine oxidase gamma subunit